MTDLKIYHERIMIGMYYLSIYNELVTSEKVDSFRIAYSRLEAMEDEGWLSKLDKKFREEIIKLGEDACVENMKKILTDAIWERGSSLINGAMQCMKLESLMTVEVCDGE